MSTDLRKLYAEKDPELFALMQAINRGKKWGNVMYEYEQEKRAKETSGERRAREAIERADREKMATMIKAAEEKEIEKAKQENAIKKKKRHVDKVTGELKRIAKMCKWQCQGEKCWAHNQKLCPYIHKGEPGWDESMPMPKSGKKKGGASTRKQRRNNSRKTRRN